MELKAVKDQRSECRVMTENRFVVYMLMLFAVNLHVQSPRVNCTYPYPKDDESTIKWQCCFLVSVLLC